LLHFLHVVREDRKLTLQQLANAAGTHRDRIARLERGERPQDLVVVQRIADALGVAPEVLTANSISLSRDGSIEVLRG
jgi:transcriptional regulator with XRE-family HTH domain